MERDVGARCFHSVSHRRADPLHVGQELLEKTERSVQALLLQLSVESAVLVASLLQLLKQIMLLLLGSVQLRLPLGRLLQKALTLLLQELWGTSVESLATERSLHHTSCMCPTPSSPSTAFSMAHNLADAVWQRQ